MNRSDFLQAELQRIDGTVPHPMVSKHVKMATSPFVFFRGSPQLYYADLAGQRISLPKPLNSLPLTCVVGDCHSSNFGFLTEEGSHGDTVIFSPNDFDDACVGYIGWDLLRFLISLELVADHCQGTGKGDYLDNQIDSAKPVADQGQVLHAMCGFLQGYRDTCLELADCPEAIYRALDHFPKRSVLHKGYKKACSRAAGGEDFTTKSALAKSVEMGSHGLGFRRKPGKYSKLADHLYQHLEQTFAPYMDDTVIDIVQRHQAGTGSVDLDRYYFLVGPERPHDESTFSRCHVVEVKAQRPAAPLHYFTDLHPVNRLNPAHLTARCQRQMQRRPDLLLDEVEWQNKHWLVRSRHHARVTLDPGDYVTGRKNANGGLTDYARSCGRALCLAHCRGDRRSNRLETQLSQCLDGVGDELIASALTYAQQVKQDHEWLVTVLRQGG